MPEFCRLDDPVKDMRPGSNLDFWQERSFEDMTHDDEDIMPKFPMITSDKSYSGLTMATILAGSQKKQQPQSK